MNIVGRLLLLTFLLAPCGMVAADDVTERAVPGPAGAPQPGLRGPAAAIPAMTVEQQLAALQQQVQSLQLQLSAIQSVVKISPNGTVIQAPALSFVSASGTMIQSAGSIAIKSDANTTVESANSMTLKSVGNTMIQAAAGMTVEAKGTLGLKGATMRLNDGTKPVATVGSAVGNGMVLTGSPNLFGN